MSLVMIILLKEFLSKQFLEPGKSLISCYGASVLNENSERKNNLLLSFLFEELM